MTDDDPSDLWNESGDVIVTFVHPDARESLPYSDPPSDWKTELVGVELVPTIADRTPEAGHAFARVLAGTSNNQFREWSATSGYSLPFNVVVTEVTFGGSIATICHGAGMGTPTLSDLVEEVCYIDANGVDQVVNDPQELKCAAGAFGFLGVVTSIVLRVEPATVADMRPTQVPLVLAIPPPEGFQLPAIVERQVKEAGITKEDMEKARKEFVRRAEEDHFHEFFWYPYQKCAWLNTWQSMYHLRCCIQFGLIDSRYRETVDGRRQGSANISSVRHSGRRLCGPRRLGGPRDGYRAS